MKISLLNKKNTGIVVVDVQEKLMPVMGRKDRVIENILKVLHLSRLFDLPVLLTEQHPRWLGSTLPEIKDLLPETKPITKMDFNCCAVDLFNSRLESSGVENVILIGVETHVCIFQTSISLLEKGYGVHVPQDAVDSRTDDNRHVGLELMKASGAVISSSETVIYQILKKAGTEEFKKMLKIIK